MPSLFKPTIVSYRTPEGARCKAAEAIQHDAAGKPMYKTVWRKKRNGEKKPAQAPILREGFTRLSEKATQWYGQFRDAGGKVCRKPLCPDKKAAGDLLAKLVTDTALGKAGLGNAFEEHHRKPLATHLADWEVYMLAEGNTARYVSMTISQTSEIIGACGFKSIADISAARVVEHLAELRKDRTTTEQEIDRGISAQTSNHYLRAMKSFTRWLIRNRRSAEDVLQHLSRLNVETDRRHERRAMSDDEFSRLVQAARGTDKKPGPAFRDLTGPGRAMLYIVAAATGFRASELASLTPASFHLDVTPPTVTVKASYSKHRKQDVQPLPTALVAPLLDFLATIEAGARVWPGTWPERAAKMLRIDLSAARQAWIAEARMPQAAKERGESDILTYKDASGRVFDFHAIRGQYITSLGRAGVPLTTAYKLARHSDPKLTANVYTHLAMIDLAGAVENLPVPLALPLARGQAGYCRPESEHAGVPLAESA